MMTSRFTSAKIPIIGSEKKNTAVAAGAVAPRNTIAMIATRRPRIPMLLRVRTVIAFSPR